MAEKEVAVESAAGSATDAVPQEVEPVVPEPEEEAVENEQEEQVEEEEQVRRFRRCQRRKKTQPIESMEILLNVAEEDEPEEEEEDEGEDEEFEDVKTISEYESIFSAVSFEWENEFYEFLDLCDPGTMDDIYTRVAAKPSYDVYGQAYYLKNCNDLNIPPILRFYNALVTSEADLTFHGLNRRQMYAICKTLEVNPTVENFILKGNPLSPGSCQSLSALLAKNNFITDLNLSGCKIGPEGAQMLARGLLRNDSIKELNLSRCYIENDGITSLAIPLKNNDTIEKINLSWNNLSGEGAEVMGIILYYNNSISHLNLDNNNMYDSASLKKFFRGLSDNSAVTYLTLRWNALSSAEAGDAAAQFLRRNKTIACLDLSDNRLDGACIKPLRRGLSGSRSLEILRLARNPLAAEDVEYLLPGVRGCRTLKVLDLQETWVRKEFVKSLNKIKLSKVVDVLYEGVYSDYTILGPDYPALILKRAQYEGMKPKKASAKREFGNLLFTMGEEPVTPNQFMEEVEKFKANISEELFPELIKQFTIPKANLVDVLGMRKKYMSLFPNFKPPEEQKPQPQLGEQAAEKKRKQENVRGVVKGKSDTGIQSEEPK